MVNSHPDLMVLGSKLVSSSADMTGIDVRDRASINASSSRDISFFIGSSTASIDANSENSWVLGMTTTPY